jgi:hypothetical protein
MIFRRAGKKWRGSRGGNFLPASRITPPARQRGAEQKIAFTFFDFARTHFFSEGKDNFSVRQAAALRRLAAGQRRFRFLDLCIRFGKIISKVCEGFNLGANIQKYPTWWDIFVC